MATQWSSRRVADVSVRAAVPALAIALIASSAADLVAQSPSADPCTPTASQTSTQPAKHWSAPLDRVVSLQQGALPLQQALARLAAAAQVRLSFSTDLLPSNRIACMAYRGVAIGDVLRSMLRDSGLEPVAAGTDQIVLSLSRAGAATNAGDQHVIQLGSVYGTADAQHAVAEQNPGISVTVLDASSAGWRPNGDLVEVLNSSVPGMWLWSAGAGGITASYGSTRGSSSFGVSGPKILIDGIEVANPLLLSHITMDAVERIEIIRGPQGSARYGADALNGVTNIITRHSTRSTIAPRIQVSSTLGRAGTQYASSGAFTQDHAMRVQLGRPARSFDFDVGLGSIGAYAPGAGARHENADASLRLISSKAVLTGTLRYLAQRIDTAGNGAAITGLGDAALASAFEGAAVTEALSLREYTAGFKASYAHSPRWSHALVAGIDGYSLGGIAYDSAPTVTAANAILRDAGTAGVRTTLRANSIARISSAHADATITFTADNTHISLRADNLPIYTHPALSDAMASNNRGREPRVQTQTLRRVPEPAPTTQSRSSTGASTEVLTTFNDRVTLTGALRVERDAGGSAGAGQTSALPMVGASFTALSNPNARIKVRASFGKGVRWPSLSGMRDHMQVSQMSLEPEQQSGMEAGIDVHVRSALSLQLTRFDQTATGLAQQMTLPVLVDDRGARRARRFGVVLQNVGAISNAGWEVQGSIRRGALSVGTAATLLNSRVLRVADGYTGDLRAGDRPLAVPARTLSVSAGISQPAWSASLTAYRASDWINYDRIAMTNAQIGDSNGLDLRHYWKSYSGFTHIGVSGTRSLGSGLALYVGAANLLNRQTGEPDNITIAPGRTYSLGLRATF